MSASSSRDSLSIAVAVVVPESDETVRQHYFPDSATGIIHAEPTAMAEDCSPLPDAAVKIIWGVVGAGFVALLVAMIHAGGGFSAFGI
jgi:hypothetical protein